MPSLCNRPIDVGDAVQDPYDWVVAEALLHDLLETSTGGTARANIEPTNIIIIWGNVHTGRLQSCVFEEHVCQALALAFEQSQSSH